MNLQTTNLKQKQTKTGVYSSQFTARVSLIHSRCGKITPQSQHMYETQNTVGYHLKNLSSTPNFDNKVYLNFSPSFEVTETFYLTTTHTVTST